MQPQPDYDFIVNAKHPAKKPMLPGGASKQSRIFIALGGALVLVIVAFIVMTLLSSTGNGDKETLTKAAQQQTEIIRISKIGMEKARDPATKNLATTAALSLQSDQSALLKRVKVPAKELALGKNSKTDVTLTTAEQSNRFDEVFTQVLQTELINYQKTIKKAYDNASGKQLKTTLADQYNHANLLASKK